MANGITPTSPTQNSCSALSSLFHQRKQNLLNCGWLRLAGSESRDLEQRLGRPVITSANAAQLNHVVTQMIKASASASDDETDTEEQPSHPPVNSGGLFMHFKRPIQIVVYFLLVRRNFAVIVEQV